MMKALSLSAGLKAFALEAPAQKGIFDVLHYQEVVDVTLTFDLDAVFNNRRSEEDYEALINFQDKKGKDQQWNIELNIRGKFRRMKCDDTPPLKIKFKKADLKNAGLATYNDFKLVNVCMEDDLAAKETLLKEYLTYKLFNQITEVSYRVQLVNITYKDVKTGETSNQMGFLIEDTAQLRARVGADKIEEQRVVDPARFDREYSKKVALFEYMIGNADWGFTIPKNVKYIAKEGMIFPVPYDFDFAALVEAPYASFSYANGQTSFYDRVYLGFEDRQGDLKNTIKEYSRKQKILYETIWGFKLLKVSTREEMINYLDTFYQNTWDIKFQTAGIGEELQGSD